MKVGQKIKKYLDEHGISQTFVANKSGIDISKLNLILNGKRKLSVDDYEKICLAIGVSVDMFCEAKNIDRKE